jgi:hypothetical protein
MLRAGRDRLHPAEDRSSVISHRHGRLGHDPFDRGDQFVGLVRESLFYMDAPVIPDQHRLDILRKRLFQKASQMLEG